MAALSAQSPDWSEIDSYWPIDGAETLGGVYIVLVWVLQYKYFSDYLESPQKDICLSEPWVVLQGRLSRICDMFSFDVNM